MTAVGLAIAIPIVDAQFEREHALAQRLTCGRKTYVAYDDDLAHRVREQLAGERAVTIRKAAPASSSSARLVRTAGVVICSGAPRQTGSRAADEP
jgi:hypothetical protein